MEEAKDDRNKEQRCQGSQHQAPNDCPAQWRILLTALTQAQ